MTELIISSDEHVVTLNEAAHVAGISLCTLRRRLADGSGPRVVRLSERRVGIRVRDLKQWIAERTSPVVSASEVVS